MRRNAMLPATVLMALLAVTSSVFGQSREANTDALERFGYTVINTRTEGGIPTWDVRDEQGRRFAVSIIGTFDAERNRALEALEETIYGLDDLAIDRLRYVVEGQRVDAIVIPGSFEINGEQYVEYMPSGMQFVFEDAVSYDFRMLVENLAVRINGQFISQEQFLDRIQRAVENPAAYIQSQDPLFLARRLEDQQSQIEELIASDQELENRDEQIADSVVSLERELVSRGQEAIEQLETQLAELGERHEQLRTDYETLRADHEELRAETIALTQEVLSLREGTIVLSARTFFGGLRAVTPEAFRRVIEIRTQNPEVPVGEVVDQVNAELPDDEPGLHAHHVEAIYAVYFNDYPEE